MWRAQKTLVGLVVSPLKKVFWPNLQGLVYTVLAREDKTQEVSYRLRGMNELVGLNIIILRVIISDHG